MPKWSSYTQSLGYADVSLTMVNTANGTRPQLKYLRGSACPQDPTTQLSTTIEFYCDKKAGRVSFCFRFLFSFSILFQFHLNNFQRVCQYLKRFCTIVIMYFVGRQMLFVQRNDKNSLRPLVKSIHANWIQKPICEPFLRMALWM